MDAAFGRDYGIPTQLSSGASGNRDSLHPSKNVKYGQVASLEARCVRIVFDSLAR